jgi:DnaK suppressor protein
MVKEIKLSSGYKPNDKEKFMNAKQQEYFRQKLRAWRLELLDDANETRQNLQETSVAEADVADRASTETDRSLELRTRDRARKLISKIDEALERIEDGSYGFCVETDEPIGIKRLEARPIATLSLEAQERHEKMEKIYRDD